MIPVETVMGTGGEGMKERSSGGEFKYDIFDTWNDLLQILQFTPHPA
jgi:hypothetical protein